MTKLPLHKTPALKVRDKVTRGFDKLPEVELVRPWQAFPVGYRFKPPGVLRDVLFQQRYIKMVEVKPVNSRKRSIKPEIAEKDED